MTTVFDRLRRVVYLLVLLQCCVCTAEPTPACPQQERGYLSQAKKGMEIAWRMQGKAVEEGKDLLNVWREAVEACEKNYEAIGVAVNKTIDILEGVRRKDSNEEVAGVKKLKCDSKEVREYRDGYIQMMEKFNAAMPHTQGLAGKVNATRLSSTTYYDNLVDMQKEINKYFNWYNDTIHEEGNKGCLTKEETKLEYEYVLANHTEVETIRKGLFDLRGKSHVCALNSELDISARITEMFDEIKRLCAHTVTVERVNATQKPKKEEVTEEYPNGEAKRWKKKRLKEDARRDFKQRMEAERPRRLAAEEEAKRLREEAKRAEARRRAEEERRRIEEENTRRAREEEEARRKKDEEEKAKQAAVQKAEEEAKRVAAEKAKQAAAQKAEEEARRVAAEKAKKKKDGSSSPALVHSPSLFLLVLSVLGCTLVY
ncbi:uncharacterized protein TM35_000941070 [Trypanosoma theileri]|uniref:Uncharacterized protein n=1 Tax=Trypanosoma theileri TaxID=67003 RepID=A0A1X0NEF1_9TRYP|nr:uncharacterized protein TM35_000941070 [Trypanosoma theileri]ORC82257.1 hypothetical protein TM35_000941070 [Trypanosoma theileri]